MSPTIFKFPLAAFPENIAELRQEVREFLGKELRGVPAHARARSWSGFDPDFSRKLAAKGWIGMTWPRRYGGHERSPLERYAVIEELLAAGAPVCAHWTADRQSGPLLLRFGTESQRMRSLPKIASGEIFFCIGMSEPNAGSDLAAVSTRAVMRGGRWRLTGTKIWTTNANRSQRMIVLARTGDPGQARHAGLSQFLVELPSPGITIRPITDFVGEREFNEVQFDDAILDEDALIGCEGDGWKQVGAELALERSGPERIFSSAPLLMELMREATTASDSSKSDLVAKLVAQLWILRKMSASVARRAMLGENPALEAALVKDLGTTFEQSIPMESHALVDPNSELLDEGEFERTLAYLLPFSRTYSIRGGTREILRGVIAKGLDVR